MTPKFAIDDDKKIILIKDNVNDTLFFRRFMQICWIICGIINMIIYIKTKDNFKLITVIAAILWFYIFITDLQKSFAFKIDFEDIKIVEYKSGTFQNRLNIYLNNNKIRTVYTDLSTEKIYNLKTILHQNTILFKVSKCLL